MMNLENMQKSDLTNMYHHNIVNYHKLTIKAELNPNSTAKYPEIIIQTYENCSQKPHSKVIRQINQLDALIEYANDSYGKHIIPFLNSDALYNKKIPTEQINNLIEDYLNNIKDNKHCQQDTFIQNFILLNGNFPKKRTYDRILKKANNFSRNYLNAYFTRKSLAEMDNIESYANSYQELMDTANYFNNYRQIFQLKLSQFTNFEELMADFTQLAKIPCLAVQPADQTKKKVLKNINLCAKSINEAQEAHQRWLSLGQTVRQMQANIYKGIAQSNAIFQKKNQQLRQYTEVLSKEYIQLSNQIILKIEQIINDITIFSSVTMSQSLLGAVENIQEEIEINK